jgi:hypothetical protein
MVGRIVAAASSGGTLLPELTETDSLNPGERVNRGSRSGSSGYCPPPLTFDAPTVAAAANGLPSAIYLAAAITTRNRLRLERKINASIWPDLSSTVKFVSRPPARKRWGIIYGRTISPFSFLGRLVGYFPLY